MTREHEVLFSAVMSMTSSNHTHDIQPEIKHEDDDW
jgi:hypothetical protein